MTIEKELADLKAQIAALPAGQPVDFTPVLDALAPIAAGVAAIQAELGTPNDAPGA